MIRKTLYFVSIIILIGIISVSCTKEKKVEKTNDKPVSNSLSTTPTSTTPGAIGSKAADFTLIDLDGNEVTLENYKDKVIVLNFWATWCPPCRKEIPDFIKMYEKHEKDGMVIVGVGGFREGFEKIKPFIKDNGINYPIVLVKSSDIKTLTESYGGIGGIPTTFLIDKNGIIRQKWEGPRSEEVFMNEINKYL